MEYQKTNVLFVDGVVGSDTLKKLKDSAKKLKDIKNYNNVEMTDEEIEKIKKNTIKQFEYLKRDLDKKEANADEIQRAFEQEKSETQNTINVVVTDIKNKDKEPTKEEVDEFEGLLEKISSGGLKEDDLK
jgi:alanyl-tRNA synthetase